MDVFLLFAVAVFFLFAMTVAVPVVVAIIRLTSGRRGAGRQEESRQHGAAQRPDHRGRHRSSEGHGSASPEASAGRDVGGEPEAAAKRSSWRWAASAAS